jgi:flagellar protein FlaJ
MKIPFIPTSEKRAKRLSRHYIGWGEKISKIFPSLGLELGQVGFNFEARQWISMALFSFLNYFSIIFSAIFIIAIIAKVVLHTALMISLLSGFVVALATFSYTVFYPKMLITRSKRDVEKNLPHALHHLLIEVRSGMPLSNSFMSLARGNYGVLSKEFQNAVNEINTGKSEIETMEIMARENKSLFFRRILWQIVNSMKSGADVGSTLKEIVDQTTAEQKAEIKKYGTQLNSLALFYMMFVVIFPTLGIVFLLILTSFVGTVFNVQIIMMGVLAFLVLIQFIFIGLIKGKRPAGL